MIIGPIASEQSVKKPQVRKSTIAKAVAAVYSLRKEAMDLEHASEAKYNFVTEKTSLQASKLYNKADKINSDIVARLIECGLCSDELGLTHKDACNPLFDGIDALWEIGNGDWC